MVFPWLSVILLFILSITFFVVMPVFDSISSNIAVVLSINPSANVFVFGDFNACHKDWLTFSGRIDRPGKLCYNFSIPKNLTQIVNFPTLIHDCDSHSPALLDSFLSSDISIVLQWLSLHWEILIMLLSQFPLTFHQIVTRCPVSLHSLWLFSCLLGWSLWSFERCSMGGYL